MLKTASMKSSDKQRNTQPAEDNTTFKLLQKYLNSFRNGLVTKKKQYMYIIYEDVDNKNRIKATFVMYAVRQV